MTLETAIAKIKSKDEKGLAFIYDNYSNVLLGLINNILQNKEVAEEVLQQVYVKIWDNIEKFNPNKAGFFTWASTIARNTAIDKHRLVGYQNNKKTNSLDSDVYHIEVQQKSTDSLDIEKIMTHLDDKYKIVLDTVYLKGYSQRDAAKHLDIPVGTVKTRLRTAISILRENFKDEKKYFMGLFFIILLLILVLWIR